jgi:uncharacterized protein YcbK (DUF882 family)
MKQSLLENHADDEVIISSKRHFLKSMACGSLLTVGALPEIAKASSAWSFPTSRSVAFENVHTGDKIRLTYFENGRYVRDALHEISHALRDYHTDDVYPIDPALVDQLYDLKNTLGTSRTFHIVSGYRSPVTNARLRRVQRGVAKHSLHMEGRAIDIRVEGIGTRTLRDAALSLRSGGVGYYPYAHFVHLDTGQIRTWRK